MVRLSDSRMEIWLCNLSATPSVSKPGPRLAVVAGTRTVTDGFLIGASILHSTPKQVKGRATYPTGYGIRNGPRIITKLPNPIMACRASKLSQRPTPHIVTNAVHQYERKISAWIKFHRYTKLSKKANSTASQTTILTERTITGRPSPSSTTLERARSPISTRSEER